MDDTVWCYVVDNDSFVPFLQSVRSREIVIALTHDEAARM